MIEQIIIDTLKTDAALLQQLSTYKGCPAIFSDSAPQDAILPYLVLTVSRNRGDDSAIQLFNIMIDYFDSGKSRIKSRFAIERIEFTLDNKILKSDRFDSIRTMYFADSSVPHDDPTDIHHNIQFTARAGRKKWMQQL